MSQPLLSIVIPTKDRYYYLEYLLDTITKYNPDDIEIILQDNTSDNSEILNYLQTLSYPLLKYNHIKEQIPIYLNADKAILNSTGKYICFIGDDDGVTSEIMKCVKWMDVENVDVVVTKKVRYWWPDRQKKYKALDNSSILKVEGHSNKKTQLDSIEQLYKVMKIGCVHQGLLPQPYHGIVKKEVFDRVYQQCGTYFPGPSPDIASAVALALLSPKYVFVDSPIIISGASKFHNGGAHKMKSNAANIEDLPFLPPNTKENWETKVPQIWTGETIWCESAIKAMRKMGRDDLADQVNFEYLYAKFIAYHFPLRKMAWNLSQHKGLLILRILIMMIKRYCRVAKRVIVKDKTDSIYGIQNTSEAINWIESKYVCEF